MTPPCSYCGDERTHAINCPSLAGTGFGFTHFVESEEQEMKVAIIGMGVVGSAVKAGSANAELIVCVDKYAPEREQNVERLRETDLAIVCVPTPTKQSRQCLEAVCDVCERLRAMRYEGVVVIKSTVLPGTCKMLSEYYSLRIVHNPEFLSARTAVEEYATQKTVLMSGARDDCKVLHDFLWRTIGEFKAFAPPDYRITELAKYLHNCSLAIQLSFLNEVHALVGDQLIFDAACEMAKPFGNIGQHVSVPGPDGKRGWGGACFPKDTIALLSEAEAHGLQMWTLAGAVATNRKLREEMAVAE